MSPTFDVVVVGGGIGGMSVAYELAEHASVLVVEREPNLTHHSTGRSAAIFLPGLGGAAFSALSEASEAFLVEPPEGLTDAPVLTPRGDVIIDVAEDARHLVASSDGHTANRITEGARVPIDNDQLLELVPWVDVTHVDGGSYQEDVRDLDVPGLHQAFLRGARQRGIEIWRSNEAVRGHRRGDGWRVEVGDDQVDAGAVVNAGGAWGDVVAERFGARPVGLTPCRRTAFTVATPGVSDGPLIHTASHDFYAKPESGGQLLMSPMDQTPVEPQDIRPEEEDVARTIELAQHFIRPELRVVRTAWAGLRTFAPDADPVLGPDPEQPGFHWCCGQGGTGIQSAPAAARVVAAGVLGSDLPADVLDAGLDVGQIDPGRFHG